MKLVHMASGLAVAIALAACADKSADIQTPAPAANTLREVAFRSAGGGTGLAGCKYVYFSNTTTSYPATECLRYRLDPSESRTAA